MANHALLNSIEHKDLKVITTRSAELGDNIWYAQTFFQEYRAVQAHYPILFQKNPETGKFLSIALFGFKHEENLFLENGKWTASYIPIAVKRMPFYIGFQNTEVDGTPEKQRVLTIDLDSPRVNTTEGTELFMPYGGNSEYLDTMANALEALHHGLAEDETFIEALTQCELLESVNITVTLQDGSENQLMGFYTINEDKLNNLSQDIIARLHQAGYLQAIHMILASQANIQTLVDKKSKLSAAE